MNTVSRSIVVVLFALLSFGCTSYDAFREKTLNDLKDSHAYVVRRAKEGKLTKVEYRSSLQTYDTAILDEHAKGGKDLEGTRKKNEEASDKLADDLFGR